MKDTIEYEAYIEELGTWVPAWKYDLRGDYGSFRPKCPVKLTDGSLVREVSGHLGKVWRFAVLPIESPKPKFKLVEVNGHYEMRST